MESKAVSVEELNKLPREAITVLYLQTFEMLQKMQEQNDSILDVEENDEYKDMNDDEIWLAEYRKEKIQQEMQRRDNGEEEESSSSSEEEGNEEKEIDEEEEEIRQFNKRVEENKVHRTSFRTFIRSYAV